MAREFDLDDWRRYAEAYDGLNQLLPYCWMLDDVIAALAGAKYPLLDAGCGTANLICRLMSSTTERIIGVDLTGAMLDRAREKCPGIEFLDANLNERLPFGDNSFETVTCINALYAVENPEQTLKEFFRVLMPEGRLVVVTPKEGYENGLMLKAHCGSEKPDSYWLDMHTTPEREEILIREAVSDQVVFEKFLEVARFNRRIRHEGKFHFFEPDGLYRVVSECGFENIEIKPTYARQNLLVIARRKL